MAKLDLSLKVEIPEHIAEYLENVRNFVHETCEDCKRCGNWDRVLKKVKGLDKPVEFMTMTAKPVQPDEKGPSRSEMKGIDKPAA